MAEYNVQINKYNANNLGYDQLYPEPMKHADTHLPNGSDPLSISMFGISNPNLLDNWYFGNPNVIVDQRGGYVIPPNVPSYTDKGLTTLSPTGYTTAYRTVTARTDTYCEFEYNGVAYYVAPDAAVRGYVGTKYTIDRWHARAGVVVLPEADGVKIVANNATSNTRVFSQVIDNKESLAGKTVTFSALFTEISNSLVGVKMWLGDGNSTVGFNDPFVSSEEGSITTSGLYSITTTLPDNFTRSQLKLFVGFPNGGNEFDSFKVVAAKLEIGPNQTLAHQENGVWVLNEIPNYATELAKCQRYQVVIKHDGNSDIATGNAASATAVNFAIPVPVSMRIVPTATFENMYWRWGTSTGAITQMTAYAANGNATVYVSGTTTGVTAGNSVQLRLQNGYLILDANL